MIRKAPRELAHVRVGDAGMQSGLTTTGMLVVIAGLVVVMVIGVVIVGKWKGIYIPSPWKGVDLS